MTVYTDGSCNTIHKTGGWAVILLMAGKKIILKGLEENTTNQRMELTAVLKALEYVEQHSDLTHPVHIYADSQYVIDIQKRMPRLQANNYLTKKGKPNRNDDLVRKLVGYLQHMNIVFTKVISHLKKNDTENLNREVDKLARSIVRGQLGRLED
ncbi:MAG: hypothetical protein C0490_13215 [Marivirga sp.]|nr:hypothetical protein [Marivirga sp.]